MPEKSRILIVDDEEIVLDSCVAILGETDYEIRTASDGEAGLSEAEVFRPDLVFVDLKMPGMTGFDVLQGLLRIDPAIVSIVITGYATVDSAVEAMKKGAWDFLPKPFTPEEFRIIARRGLERRRLVMEAAALRREKEMLRDQFAAVVSHEIRSPLGAVQQNMMGLIAEMRGTAPPAHIERLERLRGRIDGVCALVNTWLRVLSVDFSRIRESFRTIELAPVLRDAAEAVSPEAVRKDITIEVSADEGLPPVHGDPVTLAEALMNVLGNAVKYSRPGTPVTLEAVAEESGVLLRVADRGVGIAAEDLPHVMDDFYRGRTGEAVAKGSGLGLAITRRIVEAHGGTISVRSDPGKGTTVDIRLPAAGTVPPVGAGAGPAAAGGAAQGEHP